jgi:hypothetical protein
MGCSSRCDRVRAQQSAENVFQVSAVERHGVISDGRHGCSGRWCGRGAASGRWRRRSWLARRRQRRERAVQRQAAPACASLACGGCAPLPSLQRWAVQVASRVQPLRRVPTHLALALAVRGVAGGGRGGNKEGVGHGRVACVRADRLPAAGAARAQCGFSAHRAL